MKQHEPRIDTAEVVEFCKEKFPSLRLSQRKTLGEVVWGALKSRKLVLTAIGRKIREGIGGSG